MFVPNLQHLTSTDCAIQNENNSRYVSLEQKGDLFEQIMLDWLDLLQSS